MKYLSHIPEKITPSTRCIIMLHGVGSSESDLFSLAENFGPDMLIISLRGPFTLGEHRYAWYPVDFSTGSPKYRIEDVERGYREIISCIDEVGKTYGILTEHIFLLGFSQGAILSYYMLWKSPEKIGGIIALAGRLLREIELDAVDISRYAGKKVFIGHGRQDQMIPFVSSESTQHFVRKIQADLTFHAYDIEHTISREEIGDIRAWLEK